MAEGRVKTTQENQEQILSASHKPVQCFAHGITWSPPVQCISTPSALKLGTLPFPAPRSWTGHWGFFAPSPPVLSSNPSSNFNLGHNHKTAIIGRSCQLLAEARLYAGRTQRELSFPALASIYQVQRTRISQKLVTQPTLADLNGYQHDTKTTS